MAILQTFEMQPGEVKGWSISFAKYLARTGDSARPTTPIEYLVPEGITLVAAMWVDEGGYLKFFVSSPLKAKTYKLTFWLNTTGGERLEADVKVKVKDY
jgi:hypothetical protein